MRPVTRREPAPTGRPPQTIATLEADQISTDRNPDPSCLPASIWAQGVDSAGIIHDLVGSEQHALTARCGKILRPDAPYHPAVLVPRLRREGRPDHETFGTAFRPGPARLHASSITARALCASCARWRRGHEERIVWEVDPFELDYVRVFEAWVTNRRGRPPWRHKGLALLGWVDLGPGARTDYGRFTRRVFVLKPHDRRPGNPGRYFVEFAPCEAVDPRTLAPNEPGWKTDRAWRGVA